ncbi:hypothetical protein [Lysinibacillus sphaericus]|nr:hypothetical protein [Lysinibacillus sp. SDF0037]
MAKRGVDFRSDWALGAIVGILSAIIKLLSAIVGILSAISDS